MFVPVERLLRRLRRPASRAAELTRLRRRMKDERRQPIDDAERALAERVQEAKLAVVAELHAVTSCRTCAVREPWPVGGYDGGACCSGVTAELFDPHELAALVHAGTRVADLTPPPNTDAHAGCAFRGARGCSLAVEHRPARCTHYVCETLRVELHRGGRLETVEASLATLNLAMKEFTAAHRARLDRDVLAPLIEALESATRR